MSDSDKGDKQEDAVTQAGAPAPAPEKKSFWLFTRGPRTEKAPRRPRRRRRDGLLSAMSGLLSFLLIAAVLGAIATRHVLNEPGPLKSDKTVIFPLRSDQHEILTQLENEGVIDYPLVMNFMLLSQMLQGKPSALKPGEYLFKQNATLQQVMEELVNGRQVLHSVTIPEGLTSEQVAQRLRDNDVLAGDVIEQPKEGELRPETYKVARGFSRSQLLTMMKNEQRKLIEQIWAKRSADLPLRTPFELLTLASIVEKETGKAEERARVAAVFVNRLRKHMRLQSDPTIVYGLVGGKATLGRGILRAEIDKYTPYNTYQIDGLPPGPIANPGKAALEAAANPAQTGDLYFVADGAGGHVFADTLEQHNRNVLRWRQIERENKEKGAPSIDHATPDATPPARDQHGDAGGTGRLVILSERHEDYPPGRGMAADDGATHRLGKFGPYAALLAVESLDDPTQRDDKTRPAFASAAAQPRRVTDFETTAFASATRNPGLGALPESGDGPGFGADGESDALALLKGPGAALAYDGDVASYPAPERMRAEQRARAARLGLSTGGDELPEGVIGARASDAEGPSAGAPQTAPTSAAPARRRIVDASEGTALDPLRDKSWDLTTAKTIPPVAGGR